MKPWKTWKKVAIVRDHYGNYAYIECYFPNSDLKVSWDLSYGHYDCVEIHGDLSTVDILEHIKTLLGDKQYRRISWYINEFCGYCVNASRHVRLNFSDDLICALEHDNMRGIDRHLIDKVEDSIIQWVDSVQAKMMAFGYTYLYEPDESEIASACENNEWFFDSNGSFIHEYDYVL